MKIICLPDPSLRIKAVEIKNVRDEEKRILEDMAKTMYLKSGVGLAAVQVGINKQLVVIDIGEGLMKLINPVIVKKEGSEIQEEGCLSVPETTVRVKRHKKIVVNFLNEEGEVRTICADGLLARVIQHEIDHLLGKLIVDYLNPVKKLFLSKRLTTRKL